MHRQSLPWECKSSPATCSSIASKTGVATAGRLQYLVWRVPSGQRRRPEQPTAVSLAVEPTEGAMRVSPHCLLRSSHADVAPWACSGGNVLALNLAGRGLSCQLDDTQLSALPFLERLDLSDNTLAIKYVSSSVYRLSLSARPASRLSTCARPACY